MRCLAGALALTLAACAGPVDAVVGSAQPALGVGEARAVVLTAPAPGPTQRRITADQLAQLSPELRATPIAGIPLRSAGGRVGLLDHLLDAMDGLDPEGLSPPAANLVEVLCAPISSLDWRGTRLAGLSEVAEGLDAPLGALLAQALDRPPEAPLLPRAALVDALAAGLVATHPEAVDDQALWLRVDDLLHGLHALSHRYGPRATHPGVFGEVDGAVTSAPIGLRVRLLENPAAVPGIDLDSVALGSVQRRPEDPAALVDFEHPEWLAFEGLGRGDPLRFGAVTLRWVESPLALAGGDTVGAGRGGAAAWRAAPWTIEHLVADAAWRAWATHRGESAWPAVDAAVTLRVADGWFEVEAWQGLSTGPGPGYVWDLVLDLLAARMRDRGVAEGEGTVDVALTDVPIGLTRAGLTNAAQAALQAQPEALVDIVLGAVGRGQGEPDVYYERDPTEGDRLHFIGPLDVPRDRDNEPLRDVDYARVGFYADPALQVPARAGEAVTMVIAAGPGTDVYVGDEGDRVFRLTVGDKPDPRSLRLTVARVR